MIRLPETLAERTAMNTVPGCGNRTIHNGSHGEYSKAVGEKLRDIEAQYDRGELTSTEARQAVGRLLNETKNLLQSGRFGNINDQALVQAIRDLVP
jgi:hypothetical protein